MLAVSGSGEASHFQLHQALGGEANHVAQEIGVGGLLEQSLKGHSLVGHRRILGCVVVSQPDNTGERRWPLAPGLRFAYGLRLRAAPARKLHHVLGHDRFFQP